ncbi:acyltransferase family protein [Alteromonas sp. 14N.309.X.WAT.G.H12]|uniref:acyltransferase family protein n=1 Tax=Alteromonas sp. 14N.309.X.WAT.G.H12 TaxID=3120824 RepID=UPI002FD6D41F
MSATDKIIKNNKIDRMAWVDNLRATIVLLVVHFHCCITYSHVGDWYIKDGPEGTLTDKLPYIFFIFHLQSFFMGVLFFIAGAMVPGAIDRHGAQKFVIERLSRLGVPALLYMFIVQPLIIFKFMGGTAAYPLRSDTSIYIHYVMSGQVLSGSGTIHKNSKQHN